MQRLRHRVSGYKIYIFFINNDLAHLLICRPTNCECSFLTVKFDDNFHMSTHRRKILNNFIFFAIRIKIVFEFSQGGATWRFNNKLLFFVTQPLNLICNIIHTFKPCQPYFFSISLLPCNECFFIRQWIHLHV